MMPRKDRRRNVTATFELGAVLSVTTGKLLCDIGRVYDILNHMTGDSLFTHQLPRACRICGPHLLKQHPQLAGIDASNVNTANWRKSLKAWVEQYGSSLPVEPLPIGDYVHRNPIEEACDMVGVDRVVVVRDDNE
jgi:hypothetical protein